MAAAAIATWQVAIVPQSTFPILPAYVLGGLTVVALYMCFATVWGWWPTSRTAVALPNTDELAAGAQVEHFAPICPADPAGLVFTDRWRSTVNDVSSEVLQLQNNTMSHPSYMRRPPSNPPPSVRIGMSVACSPLDPGTPTTSEVRARFLAFLGQPKVMDLVRGLTALDDSLAWRARDDNPRHNFAAVLSVQDTKEPPVAWARLLLPEELTRRYGRDIRDAYLVLYVEPRSPDGSPAPAASLISWHRLFRQALNMPSAVAGFLTEQLGLSSSSDPAAEVGVWLKAQRSLAELIDVDGYTFVQGSPQSNWYMGFAIADPDGEPPDDLARAWLRQVCDSALHLDDYEADLASLGKHAGGDQADLVVDTDEQQSTPSAADALAQRFSAEWAADISLFTDLKEQPTFEEVSKALRRAAEMNIISKYGVRAPLENTSTFLRIPHPGEWPIDSVIPLHVEERWLEGVFVHEWSPGQSFVDAFFSIATKLRDEFRWEGEAAYDPDATFAQFSSLLLYGVEMIRKGYSGVINRIFQIVGDDWIIAEWELIDKENHYQILFRRFNETDWQAHVTEKTWVNQNNFVEAFGTAQLLIYNDIFEGRLPPGWTPPRIWPFKNWLDDGIVEP